MEGPPSPERSALPRWPWWMEPASGLGALFVRTLRRLVRWRFHGDETIRSWESENRRFVLVFWHRHLLLMRYAYRGRRMSVLSSRSRDGELSARVLRKLGIQTCRGSTTRGGSSGLRSLLREARQGSDLAITPDGPRGPSREVQPGVVKIAAAAGYPVIPVALAASRAHEISSWDRMPIPLPGSRVEVVYGEPMQVPRDAVVEEWVPRIREALLAVETRAEALARSGASR